MILVAGKTPMKWKYINWNRLVENIRLKQREENPYRILQWGEELYRAWKYTCDWNPRRKGKIKFNRVTFKEMFLWEFLKPITSFSNSSRDSTNPKQVYKKIQIH